MLTGLHLSGIRDRTGAPCPSHAETLEGRAFFIESAEGAPFMADAAEAMVGGALRLLPGAASCAGDVKMPGAAPAEPGTFGHEVLLISRRGSWSPRRPRC